MIEHSTNDGAPGTPPEMAALEADIERTREDLAETVDALAARLDVKSRIRHRLTDTRTEVVHRARTLRETATDARGRPTPVVMIGAGVLAAASAAMVVALWRGRRNAHDVTWRRHR